MWIIKTEKIEKKCLSRSNTRTWKWISMWSAKLKERYRKETPVICESSSEFVSSNSEIYWEGEESNPDIDSDQDLNRIQEVRDDSNLK